MGFGFINHTALRFSGISDDEDPVYTAAEFKVYVVAINIVNRTSDVIWISAEVTGSYGNAFFQENYPVPKYTSLMLPVLQDAPQLLNPYDNLRVYSSSDNQIFDCTITLQELNERNDLI